MIATMRELDEYDLDDAPRVRRAEGPTKAWDVSSSVRYAAQARYGRCRKSARRVNGVHRRGTRQRHL